MNKIGVRKEREKKGKEGAEREGKERKYKVKRVLKDVLSWETRKREEKTVKKKKIKETKE